MLARRLVRTGDTLDTFNWKKFELQVRANQTKTQCQKSLIFAKYLEKLTL